MTQKGLLKNTHLAAFSSGLGVGVFVGVTALLGGIVFAELMGWLND